MCENKPSLQNIATEATFTHWPLDASVALQKLVEDSLFFVTDVAMAVLISEFYHLFSKREQGVRKVLHELYTLCYFLEELEAELLICILFVLIYKLSRYGRH